MARKALSVWIFLLCCGLTSSANDSRLYGAWKGSSYTIQGVDYPMEGLMIFTSEYFSANMTFKKDEGAHESANANAGTYTVNGDNIVFTQWMQLHVRPDNPQENLLRKGVGEKASYRFADGRHLVITFPSGNMYVLEKLP